MVVKKFVELHRVRGANVKVSNLLKNTYLELGILHIVLYPAYHLYMYVCVRVRVQKKNKK
jgi:hypothetical protein